MNDKINEILANFMENIEEFSSEVAGSPAEKDMHKLDAVYDTATTQIRQAVLVEALACVGEDEHEPNAYQDHGRVRNELRAEIRKQLNAIFGGK